MASLSGGFDALRPTSWPELPETTWAQAAQRHTRLGDLADAEFVTSVALQELAAEQGWTLRQARRWLRRYRYRGLLGLVPSKQSALRHAPSDLGALSTKLRDETLRRRELLGELADQEHVSNTALTERAAAVGVSLRTLRYYHTRWRRDGLPGLATRVQTAKGKHYTVSPQMLQVVESLRLTHRDAPVRFIHELAAQYAAANGEVAPSMFQVRAICAQIPAPVLLLADGREAEFRNRYRLTYPIKHDANRIVWQIDHKEPVHVLVRDQRAASHRSSSGAVRPYLTLVIDSASRLVMASLFSYDPPDRFMVAAAIRDALRTGANKPYGGVPDEIWVDNGKDLVAQHVQQLALGLGINLWPGPPYQPQIRGIVERFHETLDTRLWATLPGFVGANVVERNPLARAELSLAELDQRFMDFVAQYHHETHSATGQTPLEFWQQHATPVAVDERLLDILLKEAAARRVLKEGIKYAGELYWHSELALLVGEDVLVRAAPSYVAPPELEVFFDGKWRCTALALGSELGAAVSRETVAKAQQRQRAQARNRIATARETLAEQSTPAETSAKPLKTTRPNTSILSRATPTTTPAVRTPDLFDFLIARQQGQS